MNIHAEPGSSVVFTNAGGNAAEREHARKFLQPGARYVVDEVENNYPSKSFVHLEEHPSRSFNADLFTDAPPLTKPIHDLGCAGGLEEESRPAEPLTESQLWGAEDQIIERIQSENRYAFDGATLRHILRSAMPISPASFSFTEPEPDRACTAWTSGAHIIVKGQCRCGLRVMILGVRPA